MLLTSGPRVIRFPFVSVHNESLESDPAGIILAAGKSSRLQLFKPLLLLDGEAAINYLASKLRSICPQVLVVVGYRGDDVESAVGALKDNATVCVHNRQWEKGMFSSLQVALSALSESSSFFVHSVDQPHIPMTVYLTLLDALRNSGHAVFIPSYNGKKGHPILCRRRIKSALLRRKPTDTTRTALAEFESETRVVPVDTEAVNHSINTPEDLSYIMHRFQIQTA